MDENQIEQIEEVIEVSEEEQNAMIDAYMQGIRYKQLTSISLPNGRSIDYELIYPFIADKKSAEEVMLKIEKEAKGKGGNMAYDNIVFPLALHISNWQGKDLTLSGDMVYTEEAMRERLAYFTGLLIDPILMSVLSEIRKLNMKFTQVFNPENLKNF